ncbi:MAG: NAD(P)H-hydrate dehydratase [Firmicutes bacterium]|nr:NAD(P)H-hydrate dehydratase [Bacillota bacterium]
MIDGMITKEFVQTIIGKRQKEIHKGDCGKVLIVAGTEGMVGAAVLAAKSALRCGSGLVQVAIPKELFPIVQVGVPEATCIERDFTKIDLGMYDAVAVGPGLGESQDSIDAVKFLLENYDGSMVMDADALNIISHNNFFDLLVQKKNVVITPHPGEAKRMVGAFANRQQMLEALRGKTSAVTVLKGHATLVATDEGETYINTTGNPGMATAGSGDVLTGIIVSLMGQRSMLEESGKRISSSQAALCGVFVHGLAGDLAAEDLGEYGLIAGDMAYYVAKALKEIIS